METSMMTNSTRMVDYSTMEYTDVDLLKMMREACIALDMSERKFAAFAGIEYQHIRDWTRKDRPSKINRQDGAKLVSAHHRALNKGTIEEVALPEPSVAIVDVINGIIKILVKNRTLNKSDYLEMLKLLENGYVSLDQKDSLSVVQLLQKSAIGKPRESKIRGFQRTVELSLAESDE